MDDAILTAEEYLHKFQEQQNEAMEVLPYDCTKCFYDKGKIRQRVYSCLTCREKTGKYCGVCYGCFISCHTNHTVHELFFKRDFQCDCGTSNSYISCNLDTIQYRQRTSNTNVYDDTFQGIHCYCQTKYNFDIQEQEMYQCYFCEDWFHDTCIGNMRNQDFEDFVCEQCLKYNDWLQIYSRDGVFCRADLFKDNCLLQCKPVEYKEFEPEVIDVESQVESITTGTANRLGLLLMYNWKDYICKCENCLKMYDEKAVSYVLIKDENVEPELDHKVDTFEEGIKELGRMDRIKALEGIRHFGKLKDGLTEYLKGFAGWFYLSLDSGKVVTEADILNYFQSLKRKRED